MSNMTVTGAAGTVGNPDSFAVKTECHLLAFGAGSFRFEFYMQNGQWQSSSESTFTSPCNRVVEVPAGMARLVVVSGNLHVECRE